MRSAAELLGSPLATGFFLVAAANRLTPADLGRPDVATAVAAEAAVQLNPWTSDAVEVRRAVLARAGAVAGLAAATLADPGTAWWWAPLPRAQVYLDTVGPRRPGPRLPRPGWSAYPGAPPAATDVRWEAYGHRPGRRFVTGTGWAGGSSLHTAVAAGVGDIAPDYPLAAAAVTVAPTARVYEIGGAGDWRRLALTHPVRRAAEERRSDPAGLSADVAPDWPAVAAAYDAVHLSLGGLLDAGLRRLGGPGERTVLWAWECEQTVWLHAAFELTALPPVTAAPPLEPQLPAAGWAGVGPASGSAGV